MTQTTTPPEMPQERPQEQPAGRPDPITAAQGRQILFYAPVGLLGGTFTFSRCGASGRQPDVIEHGADCGYRRAVRPGAAAF